MPPKKGWLSKQSDDITNAGKRRWFFIDGKTLKYSTKPKEDDPKRIPLQTCTAALAPECKRQPAFKITYGGKTMYLVAETQAMCKSWVEAINAAKSGAETPDSTPKVTLADFETLTVLGRGAYGKVQLVKFKQNGKVYAMKSMSKKLLAESDQLEQTLTEKDILLRADHPFLLGARFTFQSPTKIFLVTEYVPGGELFARLRHEGSFRESRVKLYAAEMALAIGHLHSLGVIYRDLKPENILVDRDGHLRIADFGLAKEVGAGTTRTFCGTPEYIAPEMLQKKPYTKAVDWWSYGTLVYELLTGLPPFYDENTSNMYERVLNAPVEFPDDIVISRQAKNFIMKLLAKNPAQRLGSGPKGLEEIKAHPFFAGINWDDVFNKKTTPEWKPRLRGADDTSQFDDEFTDEPAGVSYEDASVVPKEAKIVFEGFTCTADSELDNLGK